MGGTGVAQFCGIGRIDVRVPLISNPGILGNTSAAFNVHAFALGSSTAFASALADLFLGCTFAGLSKHARRAVASWIALQSV